MPPANRTTFQSIVRAGNKAWQAATGRAKPKRRKHKYVKGVYKGNFYRRRIQENPPVPSPVPKIPREGQAIMPKPLTHIPPPPAASAVSHGEKTSPFREYLKRLYKWLKLNAPVLVLNFGSLCTLTGFTRQDVLELRALSMTGSLSFCVYQVMQPPIRWAPIAWSALFAAVNGFNISKILVERKGKVVLSAHEEDLYVEHFMQHGVTPKQFEKILSKCKVVQYKKGDVIVRRGESLDKIYLITNGTTRASIGGRRLTAASSLPGHKDNLHGGDSGAWVGEMAFLEVFGREELKKDDDTTEPPNQQRRLGSAMYTIVAQSDAEVLEWTHDDVKDLMHSSHDMRAAMTRAMTAAVVGKVINFSVSRSNNMPAWSVWLDDWKNSGASVKTTLVQTRKPEEKDEEDDDVALQPVL